MSQPLVTTNTSMTAGSGSKDSAPFFISGKGHHLVVKKPPKARIGNSLLEPDVWFDQDEDLDFVFLEEEAWGPGGDEMAPDEPF